MIFSGGGGSLQGPCGGTLQSRVCGTPVDRGGRGGQQGVCGGMEGEGVAAITEIQDPPPGLQHCWVRGVGGGGRGPNITVNPSDSPQSWTPLLQHLSQESNL